MKICKIAKLGAVVLPALLALVLASNFSSLAFAQQDNAKKSSSSSSSSDLKTVMTVDEAAKLVDSPSLHSLPKIADVPASVMGLYGGGKNMAEPGGEFSAGCVGPGLHTRMILAARIGDNILFCHESGGIIHFSKVSIYKLKGQTAQLLFDAMVQPAFENLESLRKAFHSGAVKENLVK